MATKITVTVEIDRERWVEEYDVQRVADVIRRDVVSYIKTTLMSSPAGDAGAIVGVNAR